MGNKNREHTNIEKYRRPRNINIGMIIFGFIFVYILICIFLSFTGKNIKGYVVAEGSLSTNKVFRGMIIRSEEVVSSSKAGYVYYYPREGERVAVGDIVCTVDETGQLKKAMEATPINENYLEDEDLGQLKSELLNFCHNFSSNEFNQIYDFKYNLKNSILKLTNTSLAGNVMALSKENSMVIENCYAQSSGIVSYWIDGYENLSAEAVRASMFEKENYVKNQLASNELKEQNGAIYKVTTSEDWSVMIPLDQEKINQLIEEEEGYVKVRFLKNQYESWAEMKCVTNSDGESFLQLIFNNSMISFVDQRFMDVELLLSDEKGLKIPNSSIVEKDFYLVPVDFIIESGKDNKDGVLKQSFMEDGSVSSEFIETTVYNKTDSEYYLDTTELRQGDVLLKPDSMDTYTVSKKATLIGVYNINKGYADFRRIDILNQNEEYAVVRSNSKYGLAVYDYIVLDAESVAENEFLYE